MAGKIRKWSPEWWANLEKRCEDVKARNKQRDGLARSAANLARVNDHLYARIRELQDRNEQNQRTINRLQRQLAEARAIINVRRGVA
jgi:septal ring factor EnvC (AmiA/AmiB activator)